MNNTEEHLKMKENLLKFMRNNSKNSKNVNKAIDCILNIIEINEILNSLLKKSTTEEEHTRLSNYLDVIKLGLKQLEKEHYKGE